MALWLSEDDVRAVLTMEIAMERVEEAMRAAATDTAVDTPRVRTQAAHGTLHVLQAAAPTLGLAGFKYYFIGPEGKCSYVHLVNARTAKLEAVIASGWLGMTRTGAASGIAARHLGPPDARVAGQVGAGAQAPSQLEAVCKACNIERAQVYSRDPARLATFCEAMSDRLGIEVLPAASAAAAVQGADIVNVITNSTQPVLEGAWLSPGQHVNAAGSNAVTRRELDLAAVRRCDLVVVDSRSAARRECGDLLPAVEQGMIRWERLPELGEVIAGMRLGRRSARDITLYESHGMGIQDIYVAEHVLEAARKRRLGRELPF